MKRIHHPVEQRVYWTDNAELIRLPEHLSRLMQTNIPRAVSLIL